MPLRISNLQLSEFCGEFLSFSEFYEAFVVEETMAGMFYAPHLSEDTRRRIDRRYFSTFYDADKYII